MKLPEHVTFNKTRLPHSYTRIRPSLFDIKCKDEALLNHFESVLRDTIVPCPEEGFFYIERCFIYDGCFILLPDGSWLLDSIVDYSAAEEVRPVLIKVVQNGHFSQMQFSRMKVVIAKSGFNNYGHVVTDILPKLVSLWKSGLQSVILVLPLEMKPYVEFITTILVGFGIGFDVEFHSPATLKEARGVCYFTSVSSHNVRKSETFVEFVEFARRQLRIHPDPKEKIYVSRKLTEKRAIANGAAVEAVFQAFGYRVYHPEGSSIVRQIEIFSRASHVAGPLGAGLANIGWAPQGIHSLIIDPGLGDFYFWDLSALLKQHFSWMFAGELVGFRSDISESGFFVDLKRLVTLLKQVG